MQPASDSTPSRVRPSALRFVAMAVTLSACLMGQARADSFQINKGWKFIKNGDKWSEQVAGREHAHYREVARTGNFILIEDDARHIKLWLMPGRCHIQVGAEPRRDFQAGTLERTFIHTYQDAKGNTNYICFEDRGDSIVELKGGIGAESFRIIRRDGEADDLNGHIHWAIGQDDNRKIQIQLTKDGRTPARFRRIGESDWKVWYPRVSTP